MKQKKIYISLMIFLIILLLFTNGTWAILFLREQQKLKNALIPPLTEDYFSTQLTLVQNAQKNGYEINSEEFSKKGSFSSPHIVPLIKQNPDYPKWM